ncbi:MAG: TIM barrel protein [Lentisphaerae bacterium]|nr:TIM barrel protein [Lentisphaerota bacterium]
MKLAFSKSTSTAAETRELMQSFRGYGFEGLQLKANQYLPYLDEPARFLDDWGQFPGAAQALIAGCALDDAGRTQLHRTIAFGSRIGTVTLVFCHCVPRGSLTPDDLQRSARELSEIGKTARDAGIKLSLHHHFGQPVMLAEDADIFFEAVSDNAIGLTVDTAHLVKSGIADVACFISRFAHVIDNYHFKDIRGGRFEVLGRGEIDFPKVFAAVWQTGYTGWVSADEESGAELQVALKECHSILDRLLCSTP